MILGQLEKKMTLVSSRVRGLAKMADPRGGVLNDLGVVSGSDIVASQFFGLFEKRVELDLRRALNAGIRGATAQDFMDEVVDDLVFKSVLDVFDMVRNPDFLAEMPDKTRFDHAIAVADERNRAFSHFPIRSGLQVKADHVESLVFEQGRRNGAIQSSA